MPSLEEHWQFTGTFHADLLEICESWYDGISHLTHILSFVTTQLTPILWDIQITTIAYGCTNYTLEDSGDTIHMLTL